MSRCQGQVELVLYGISQPLAAADITQVLPNQKLVRDLLYTETHLSSENLLESWHDLVQTRQEAQKMFDVGVLDLEVKASIEVLFWRIAQKIRDRLPGNDDTEIPEELADLDDNLFGRVNEAHVFLDEEEDDGSGFRCEILRAPPRPWYWSVEICRSDLMEAATDAKGSRTKKSFAYSAALREIELPR